MVSSRPPRSFEEFVASQGMGVPPVKGITPASRGLPQTSSGYDWASDYRPTSTISQDGESVYIPANCPAGYRYIDGVCVFNQGGEGPASMPSRPTVGYAAGCQPGYQLIDGVCMWAP